VRVLAPRRRPAPSGSVLRRRHARVARAPPPGVGGGRRLTWRRARSAADSATRTVPPVAARRTRPRAAQTGRGRGAAARGTRRGLDASQHPRRRSRCHGGRGGRLCRCGWAPTTPKRAREAPQPQPRQRRQSRKWAQRRATSRGRCGRDPGEVELAETGSPAYTAGMRGPNGLAPARTGTSDRHDGPPVCRQRWRTRGRGGAAAAVALAACATDPDRPPNLTAGSVAKRVRTGHQRCRLCRFGVVRCPALLSARGPRQLIHCRWSSIVEFMVPVLYIQLIPLGQIVPFLERNGQVPTVLCFGLCCRATTARAFHAACSALSPPSPDGCSVAVPGDPPGTENCRHPWGIAARPAVRAP